MCANVDTTAPTSSSSSSTLALAPAARSLFSRLTSPLKRPRTRNLTDFHIRADEPHRQYAPGDLVKGAVLLTVARPIRLTHLTVCLHGFVRVRRHANSPDQPFKLGHNFRGRKTSHYLGNGHASLFQDEITLCGEGRLEPGKYQFNFELEFPGKGLPTSIDFERGTISYMLTSTITRPTAIAAISSCDTKLSLVETVDIGPLAPPRARTISLEPISKRTKSRPSKSQEAEVQDVREPECNTETSPSTPSSTQDVSSPGRLFDGKATSHSPAPSDDVQSSASGDGTASSTSRVSFRLRPTTPSATNSPRNSQGPSSQISAREKTIITNIELLKSGCLPGDNILVKLNVQHSKAIKSLHGIIVTFYRLGRIDSAPPLCMFADVDAKEAVRIKHDEYYPKSRTGLGGLSLTAAGSSSVFRKDLSQTFAPLIIDPQSLTATVTASVRVPEDVFPSISGVPGAMISFKYYVEVVVDLGGKLAGQQRHLPQAGIMPLSSVYPGSRKDSTMLAASGASTVDTDHLRREKSVVACAFELTVGTIDSKRLRSKPSDVAIQQVNERSDAMTSTLSGHPGSISNEMPENEQRCEEPEYDYHESYNSNDYPGYQDNEHYHQENYLHQHDSYDPTPLHTYIPPPETSPDENISEKERARRAEERLLPSQPPQLQSESGPSSSSHSIFQAASAPPPEAEDLYGLDEPQTHNTSHHSYSPQVTAPITRISEATNLTTAFPNLACPPEDKQELERKRLLAEASAPFEQSDPTGEASTFLHREVHEPTAPLLTEQEEEYGGDYALQEGVLEPTASADEILPRYER